MPEPINTINHGGLTVNKNVISKAYQASNGEYVIIFKTGEKLTYPEQNHIISFVEYKNPKVDYELNHTLDSTKFEISEVMGATFTSSQEKESRVFLENSMNTKIDLAANNTYDYASIQGGSNNTVVLDDEDAASINGKGIRGQGVAAQKDY